MIRVQTEREEGEEKEIEIGIGGEWTFRKGDPSHGIKEWQLDRRHVNHVHGQGEDGRMTKGNDLGHRRQRPKRSRQRPPSCKERERRREEEERRRRGKEPISDPLSAHSLFLFLSLRFSLPSFLFPFSLPLPHSLSLSLTLSLQEDARKSLFS